MIATTIAADELVLSGWSAASAFGLGADRFTAGLRAGTDAVGPLDQSVWPGPYDRAGLIPGFDIPELLGRKGTRSMDRATGIAIATVGMLLDQAGPGLVGEPERIGLVLGTSSGSVQSIMDFTRESLTGVRPFHVDPARFPNTVMNRAAGQSAIWYGLKGPNTTIAGGALTGLLALNYAVRLQRCGHGELILCGAVEEYSVQRGWLEWHGRSDTRNAATATGSAAGAGALGEGCAIFLLEPLSSAVRHGRRPLAVVRGSRFRAFTEPAGIRALLARCISDTLADAGVRPDEVRVVAASDSGDALGEQEEAAIADVLGAHRPVRPHCRALLGDTSAASSAFQLAAALAELAEQPDGVALVTGVDRDGQVGCTLLGAGG